MASNADDEHKNPTDADDLGSLSAETGGPERAADEGEDKIDAVALAALSNAPAKRITDTGADSRVQLAGAAAGVTAKVSSRPPPPPARSGMRGIALLLLGFAVGLPVGGQLFPAPRGPVPAASQQAGVAEAAPTTTVGERERSGTAQAHVAEVAPTSPPAPRAAVEPPTPGGESGSALAAAADTAPAAPQEPAVAVPAADAKPAVPAAAAAAPAAPAPPRAPLNPSAARPVQSKPAPPPPAAVAVAAPVAPAAAPTPTPQPGAADGRSVDALLDQALSSSPQKQAETPQVVVKPADTLPTAPSRDDVKRAMTVLLPAIRGCAGGQSGMATIGIVVRNDGRVANVDVTGAPFEGTASGRCMAGVVRRAKFPQFQQDSFRVQFPFAIQ